MSDLLFFDSTLRDGSHAIKHTLTPENIRDYCRMVDEAGLHTVIVGHGNGLGASSLQVGLSLLDDREMLRIARENLQHTRLGTLLIPGFGTIHDDIIPAIEEGADLFCVAAHCTEADVTRQHIEFISRKDKEVYGILMMYHMAPRERILEEARKMQSYGAKGVIIMDSAGASTPELVQETISTLTDELDVAIGFHSHNNIGLGVSNAYTAIKAGASIIDGTIRGFGAGAGNCQLEALEALLRMEGIETGLNLYKMLDASDEVVRNFSDKSFGIEPLSIISGMTGVFSAFATQVRRAAEQYNVDPRDIFVELGKRKVVGGQEDLVLDVALNLAQRQEEDETSYLLESLL